MLGSRRGGEGWHFEMSMVLYIEMSVLSLSYSLSDLIKTQLSFSSNYMITTT